MKAIVYEKFGPPEVLHLQELKKPALNEDQVWQKSMQPPSMRGTFMAWWDTGDNAPR